MPTATPVMLDRIKMERTRLDHARRALEGVSGLAPEIAAATVSQMTLAIASTDGELSALGTSTGKHSVTDLRLAKLSRLTTATDRVVREAFALAAGVLARSQGLDDGACAEADDLIAELAGVVNASLARPTIPGDTEFFHRAADVIRRRMPDYGIWDLPVMAHEFGHVVVAHLQPYDPVNDTPLTLGDIALGDWPGYSATQVEELFCDLLATYAMGPCYACALLVHRLDPTALATDAGGTHPPDAVRAAVVLSTLTLMTRHEPPDSRYRATVDELRTTWQELQALAPSTARLTAEAEESVRQQARIMLDFLGTRIKPLGYDWPTGRIRELATALRYGQPLDPLPGYRIRDVLNAAWLLRLSPPPGSPQPDQVEADARQLIGRERHGGAGDAQGR